VKQINDMSLDNSVKQINNFEFGQLSETN